ncbi:MAG: hypothetical protein ACRDV1_05800 [Actinomycetes bacterium]
MSLRRTLCTVGAAAAILAGTIPAASAKPLEHEHFVDQFSSVIEDFCGDLTVREVGDFRGNFLIGPRGADGLLHGQAAVHGTISWTNLANGKTFTLVQNFLEKDRRVTDNGDGTLTIQIMSPGVQRVIGPDGQKLFLDSGTTWFEIVVDHGGTLNDPSDDEFVAFLGILKQVGRHDTTDRDFCADINQFIG